MSARWRRPKSMKYQREARLSANQLAQMRGRVSSLEARLNNGEQSGSLHREMPSWGRKVSARWKSVSIKERPG